MSGCLFCAHIWVDWDIIASALFTGISKYVVHLASNVCIRSVVVHFASNVFEEWSGSNYLIRYLQVHFIFKVDNWKYCLFHYWHSLSYLNETNTLLHFVWHVGNGKRKLITRITHHFLFKINQDYFRTHRLREQWLHFFFYLKESIESISNTYVIIF